LLAGPKGPNTGQSLLNNDSMGRQGFRPIFLLRPAWFRFQNFHRPLTQLCSAGPLDLVSAMANECPRPLTPLEGTGGSRGSSRARSLGFRSGCSFFRLQLQPWRRSRCSPSQRGASRPLALAAPSFIPSRAGKLPAVSKVTKGRSQLSVIGSGSGIQQMKQHRVDFGPSDAPLNDEQLKRSGLNLPGRSASPTIRASGDSR